MNGFNSFQLLLGFEVQPAAEGVDFDSRKGSVSELIEVTGKKGDTIERAIAVNKFID